MRTRFLPVWFLAIALIGVGWWQSNYDAARAATYYVTNNLDDGTPNTLRGAINSATDGDEVHIVTPGPIVLTGGQLNVSKSISIKGPEIAVDPTKDPTTDLPEVSGQIAIEGISPNGSVFSIASGKSVSMSHLFITGGTIAGPSHATGTGDDGFGGGINNSGNLTLNYCTVANNGVHGGDGPDGGGAAYGGGIYSSGTLTLNYCTVKNNLAQGGTGTNAGGTLNAAYGGGIYSTGTTNINSSYIADNDAFGGGNASTPPVLATTNGGSAYGGGIAQKNSGTLNLTNSTLYGNEATSGTGTGADGNAEGGGVYVNAALFNPLQATIAVNTVTGNTMSGAGVAYSGAAPLDVNNSVIANNVGATDLAANPSFVAHNSPGINVAVTLSLPSADQYSPTYALQSTDNTYVVDQGDNTLAASLSFDQRGYVRKTGTRVDAGAVESASPTPIHSGATPLSPFYFHVLNGATYFTAADFTSSLTYPDPNTSLQAIIITQVPPSSQGYFQLDGQTLVAGSVISVGDLDKLTYVSNDGGDSAELYWKASDGSTVSTEFTSETPRWQAPSSNYVNGTNGNGVNRPSLFLQTPVHVSGTQYTIGVQVNSSAANAGTYSIALSGYGNNLNSIVPSTFSDTNPINGNSVITVTADPSTTNNYVVITATDANGNATTQSIVFSTNADGTISGVPYRDYGGQNGNGTSSPSLSVSNISQFSGITPNGDYTFYAAVSSNAHIPPSGTTASVNVYVSGASASVSPGGNPTYSATGSASGTATITLHVTSGTHIVYVNATDINGNTTTYRFFYKGDARPDIDATPASGQHVAFGSTYTQPFSASDTDFYVPDTSMSPEPLRFQIDQEGYAASVSDPIDYNIKKGNIGSFGASDYTGGAFGTKLTTTYSLQTGIGKTISKPGVYALRVSLTDYWGLGRTFVYTVIVDPPADPIWNGPGTQVAQLHAPFNLDLNDYVTNLYPGATPTYQVISGLPSWADFDSSTGVISSSDATPTGTSTVTVSVNDGLGNVVPQTFTIQVVNGGPVFDSPPTPAEASTVNYAVGDSVNIPVAAHDPNGDTVSWSISGWGALSIAPSTGNTATITSAALTLADLGNHAITLTASDGTNNSVRHFTIKVTNGNTPTITTSVQSTYNITAGSNFSLPLSASDADGADTLTYTLTGSGTITPGAYSAGPPTTQAASYDFNAVPAGSYTITITVKDANNNVSNPVTFKINAGTGTPPSISLTPAGPSFNASTGQSIPSITATASDADAGENLTFTLSGAPVGMTLSSPSSFSGVASGDPKSVTLQWTPTSGQAGSYTFDVIVTDSQGFTDSVPVTINVTASTVDHPPVFGSNPSSAIGYVGVPFSLPIQASDPDGDGISFSAANLPPGLFINSVTGVISGTPTTVGTYSNVQVTVTDDSALTNGPMSATVTFTIIINQVNPPIISDKLNIVGGSPYTVSPGASFIKQFTATDKDYPENLTFTATYTDDNGATNTPLNGSTYWSQFNQFGPNSQGGTTASSTFTWDNIPVGVHVVTVVATDGSGNTDQVTFTVQSGNAPQLTVTPLAPPANPIKVTVGSAMPSVTATATDADNNENLSFTLENAPSGMSFSGTSSFTNLPSNTSTPPVTVQWTPTLAQAGTYTFNVVVTDSLGLRSTQPVTVQVIIPGVPTLTVLPAISGIVQLNVNQNLTEVLPTTFFKSTDTDENETLTFNAVNTQVVGSGGVVTWSFVGQSYVGTPSTTAISQLNWSADTVGTYKVEVTATDGSHTSPTQTFYINVVNSAPVVTNPGDQTLSIGSPLNLGIVATDADNDTLTYSASGLPGWASINTSTGIITGTPAVSDVGTSNVTVSVSDGVNPAVSVLFKITVVDSGVPSLTPVTSPVELHVNQNIKDVLPSSLFTATDSDANETLTFGVSSVQTVGSGGVITESMVDQSYTGSPSPTTAKSQLNWSADTVGTYKVTVTVTDSQTHVATRVFYVNVVNDPPVVTNPGNQSVSIGTAVNIPVVATDADNDTLTYSASGLPSWATINSSTGIISGTPTLSDVGASTVTVTVSDGVNTPDPSVTFLLTVVDQGIPTLTADPAFSSPVSLNVNELFEHNFKATDSDANETLTFNAVATTISGSGTATVTTLDQSYSGASSPTTKVAQVSVSANAPGTYKIDVTVTDSQGHVATQTFYINVVNSAPVVTNPGDQTLSIGSPLNLGIVATDADNDTLTYSASGLPGWASINTSTGIITGTPAVSDVGTSNVTVSVSDGVNPAVSVLFKITVVDQGIPTLNATPAISSPVTLNVGQVFTHNFTATDSDANEALTFGVTTTTISGSGTATATLLDQSYDGIPTTTKIAQLSVSATAIGTYKIHVTVTDSQGHTAAQTFFINVVNAPPVVTNPPLDQMVSYGTAFNLTIAATDVDSDPLQWKKVLAPGWMTVTDNGDGTVTLGGTPQISDVGTSTIQLTVEDGVNPPVPVSFKVTVTAAGVPTLNADPAISSPVTLNVNQNIKDVLPSNFTATDTDANATLTFGVSSVQTVGSGGVITESMVDQSYVGIPTTTAKSQLNWSADKVGTYKVTVSVTDGSHTPTVVFYINVVNGPPVMVDPGTQTVTVGSSWNLQLVATDPDSDPLTFAKVSGPGWVSVSNTGLLTGTPQVSNLGNNDVVVSVSDGVNPPVLFTVKITVTADGVPTLSSVVGPVKLNLNQNIKDVLPSSLFTATDSDANETLTFGVSSVQTVGSGGVITESMVDQSYVGTPTTTAKSQLNWSADTVGTYKVVVTVTDSQSHATSQTFYINVVNDPPVVQPIADQSVSIGESVSIQVHATDPDNDTLTYSMLQAPLWMNINTSTGEITNGTAITASNVGTSTVEVSVSDGVNPAVTTTFQVTVVDSGIPTLSTVVSPITLHVGETFTNLFTSTDSDAGDTLTFNAQTFHFNGSSWVPDSATPLLDQGYENGPPTKASALLTWPATAIGNYRVDVTVTDSQGHTTTRQIFINVVNGPPVIQPIADQSVTIGDNVSIQVNATDPDGDPMTYQLVSGPSWLQIDSAGLITNNAPITASMIGSYLVTVSVDDGVTRVPPVIPTVSFTLTVDSTGVPTLDATPSISSPVPLNVNQVFTNNFTSTDSDANENLQFAVTTTPEPGATGTATATMTDQSYNGTPTTTKVSQVSVSADGPGTYKIDVSVTDSQSHTVTRTFYIKVQPVNAAPTVSNPGTWIASADAFSTLSIFASDPNGDPLTYSPSANMPAWVVLTPSASGVILSGTPGAGDVGTTNVTVNVSDGTNTVTVSFQIQVVASGVPTLQATPIAPANPEQATTNQGYSKIFLATDGDYPDDLIFTATVTDTATALPVSGATMDTMYESGSSTTGTIKAAAFNWTPTASGTYKVVISVTDNQAHVTSLTFTIHVSAPPTITVTPPTTLSTIPGLPITPIPVQVSDPDDHETLTVTLDSNAPAGMTVKSPSTFSNVASNTAQNTELNFTPTSDQANTSFTFNVIVTDSSGQTASQQITVNVGAVNAAPVIVSPASGSSKSVVTGHTVYLPVIATDAENNTLTYSATGLPAGLSIDPNTGVIGGTVTATAPSNSLVTISVTDNYHVTPTTSIFNISVGSTNHNPTLAAIPDQTLIVGQTLNLQAVGSDPDNDLLTYSQVGLPGTWATFDTATGKMGGISAEGTWNVTVTVDDGNGGTASQTFKLRVLGLFSSSLITSNGYANITYTVTNITSSTINPVVRGSLTGGGYLKNEDAFFNASQGIVDDQWANPILQRQLDPTKNTRILTWTVGDLAPGASATLTITVPIKSTTPHGTELTNTWSIDFGTTHQTLAPVTNP